jgi:hypothetical protein
MPWSDQPEPPAGILYTYAFLPTPGASLCQFIQQTPGIQRPLQVFSPPGGRIAAAIEPLPDPAALQASDEVLLRSALRHDEVLCRLFAQTPLLPLRFGTCFLSAEKLGAHLLTQQAEYEQALAALGKRAEYCLKGRVHTPLLGDPPPAPSGTAYLLARKQAYLQQRQAQEQQQQELAVLQQLWPPNWPVQRGDPQSSDQALDHPYPCANSSSKPPASSGHCRCSPRRGAALPPLLSLYPTQRHSKLRTRYSCVRLCATTRCSAGCLPRHPFCLFALAHVFSRPKSWEPTC